MREYSVAVPWHLTVFVKVKANNKKEAKEKGINEAYPSICSQCSHNGIQIEEFNGDAEIDVEEIK